jgi:hypothetical protein
MFTFTLINYFAGYFCVRRMPTPVAMLQNTTPGTGSYVQRAEDCSLKTEWDMHRIFLGLFNNVFQIKSFFCEIRTRYVY